MGTPLTAELQTKLDGIAQEVRTKLREAGSRVVEVGIKLLEARKILGAGRPFETWCLEKLSLSQATAYRKEFPLVEGVERSIMPLVPSIMPAGDALNLARGKLAPRLPVLNCLLVDTDFSNCNGTMKLGVSSGQNTQVLQITKIEGQFPDYSQVLPERSAGAMRIGFKVAVFLKLLDTLKSLDVDSIEVQIPADNLSPVRVDASSPLGEIVAVIMPAKI